MKYIREYNQFVLEELRKIVSGSSGSGRTKEVDWIYDDPEDAKSTSAGILLKKDLQDQEFKDMAKSLGPNVPDWKVKGFIKKGRIDTKMDKLRVTMNNLQFLKDKLKERGVLECEYCNKGPLVIYDINPDEISQDNINDNNYRFNTDFNPKDGATADHKIPQSKGGDKFNYSNLAVCCSRCNKLKGNMTYDSWMRRLSTTENKDDLMLDIRQMLYELDDQGYQVNIKYDKINSRYIELDISGRLKEGGITSRLNDASFFSLEDICEDIDRVIQYMKSIGFNYYFFTNNTRVNNLQNQDFNKLSHQIIRQEKVYLFNRVRLVFTKKDKSDIV